MTTYRSSEPALKGCKANKNHHYFSYDSTLEVNTGLYVTMKIAAQMNRIFPCFLRVYKLTKNPAIN